MQVFFPEPFRKIHSTQVTWSGPFRAGGAADLHLGSRRCNKINWKLSKVSLVKAWPSWYCILFVLMFVVFDCFCLQRSIQNHGVSNDLCFQPLLGTTIQTDNPGTVGCPSKNNSQIYPNINSLMFQGPPCALPNRCFGGRMAAGHSSHAGSSAPLRHSPS